MAVRVDLGVQPGKDLTIWEVVCSLYIRLVTSPEKIPQKYSITRSPVHLTQPMTV